MFTQKHKPLNALADSAAWLTWLLVVSLPIGVGVAVRVVFESWHPLIAWFAGASVFLLCFLLAEGFWRALRWLLSGGNRVEQPRPQTDKQLVADLISDALTQSDSGCGYVMRSKLPSDDPEIAEAYNLLQRCLDDKHEKFDQIKLNLRVRELVNLMNRLRS